MGKETFRYFVWVILVLIFSSTLFIFPNLMELNPIIQYLGCFILGMLCSFLSGIIVNKFYKK